MDNYTNITKCRCCHGEDLIPQFAFSQNVPLAGQFCDTLEEAKNAELFPLTLVQCQKCGAVQVRENVSDSILYSKYNYSSSDIPALVAHFKKYADMLISYNKEKSNFTFLEVGSNSNALIQHLPTTWNIIAVDPSDVAVRANKLQQYSHIKFFNEGFDLDFVKRNRLENTVDHVFAANCMAHITDLKPVFQGIAAVLSDNGTFCIEVGDLDAMFINGEYDFLYHEHKIAYSLHSLAKVCSLAGLYLLNSEKISNHGGSIRALFAKIENHYDNTSDIEHDQIKFKLFAKIYDSRYNNPVAQKLLKNPNNIAYGASGRANTWFNNMSDIRFSYVVDESPLRVGKYIPHVGIPIVPKEMLDTESEEKDVIVTAHNYLDSIATKNSHYTNLKFIKPF